MIVRTWSGRVPLDRAAAFERHLARTGIADYRTQPGCSDIALWRREADGWAVFTLVSTWRDLASIRAYAGSDPTAAILYPDDDRFALVPDRTVTHHELIRIDI